MARNPKDVLVSYYYFHQIAGFLPTPSSFEDFVNEFLEGTGRSQGLRWLSEPSCHPAGGEPCSFVPVALRSPCSSWAPLTYSWGCSTFSVSSLLRFLRLLV